jgi:hypothetical protein
MNEDDTIELASRHGGGIVVQLFWRRGDESVTVAVADDQTGEVFQIEVARERAFDAYTHPFAYAPAA